MEYPIRENTIFAETIRQAAQLYAGLPGVQWQYQPEELVRVTEEYIRQMIAAHRS